MSVLADTRDIFGLSIADLMPIYLIGFIWPIAIFLFLHFRKTQSPKRSKSPRKTSKWLFVRLMLNDTTPIVVSLVFISLAITDRYYLGFATGNAWMLLATYFSFTAFEIAFRVFDFSKISLVSLISIQIVCGFIVIAAGAGFGNGQAARFYSYSEKRHTLLHCGDVLIIKRIGSSYLAVKGDGQKVVTSLDCKVQMIVPPHRVKHERHLQWWWPFIRYEPITRMVPVEPAKPVTAPTSGPQRPTTSGGS